MIIDVRENILSDIEETLKGISKERGYNNTFAPGAVQRYIVNGNRKSVFPCAIITAGPEDSSPGPDPYYTNHFTVGIEMFTAQEETDLTPTDKILNSLRADILKALMATYTRGGYARETILKSSTPIIEVEGQPYAGLILELDIVYLQSFNDPAVAG